jgi:hypothetical protein
MAAGGCGRTRHGLTAPYVVVAGPGRGPLWGWIKARPGDGVPGAPIDLHRRPHLRQPPRLPSAPATDASHQVSKDSREWRSSLSRCANIVSLLPTAPMERRQWKGSNNSGARLRRWPIREVDSISATDGAPGIEGKASADSGTEDTRPAPLPRPAKCVRLRYRPIRGPDNWLL